MGEDEKRAIKMAVLLELEDAREALALLRAKAERWYRVHQQASCLLARMQRNSAQQESGTLELRRQIQVDLKLAREAMDLDSVFALDSELEAAATRLKKAETGKREIFG